ncbi:dynein regulatory complex subunit 4 [Oncorhynchus masou masou]|uniref:dynein regulatory complex subunit 4 n=1 Tax=Oncorhynchus masou masou TaxID=90313 RepID=UPI00318348B6
MKRKEERLEKDMAEGAKARLKVADKEMKDLKWEHEVLEQRFSKVQVERDDLYKKFTQAIQEVQQKSGFMNLLLERKLGALTNTLEKKEAQLSNLVVVTRKLEGKQLQLPTPSPAWFPLSEESFFLCPVLIFVAVSETFVDIIL